VAWKGLVLEALHQYSILGKEDLDDVVSYSDMVGSVLGRLGSLDEEEEEID
jgi:magnesium chelatase subunit I